MKGWMGGQGSECWEAEKVGREDASKPYGVVVKSFNYLTVSDLQGKL